MIIRPGSNNDFFNWVLRYELYDEPYQRMFGACGVRFQGKMHFFGGTNEYWPRKDLRYQHFIIEEPRKGIPRMVKLEDLNIGLQNPACASFQIASQYFPWSETSIVVLCFGYNHNQACYSFDGKLEHASDTYLSHYRGGITNYRQYLLTVGGINPNVESFSDVGGSQITEVGFQVENSVS